MDSHTEFLASCWSPQNTRSTARLESRTTDTHTVCQTLTPMSIPSPKRKLPEAPVLGKMTTPKPSLGTSTASKRRKLSPSNAQSSMKSNGVDYLTPPITPGPPIPIETPTINLKVVIPERQISPEEQRRIKLRVAAARRWIPKLQKPFPKKKEIKDAYQYKLMRHYTDGQTQVPVIRPHIDTSPRVEVLRKRFPLLKPPSVTPSSSANIHSTGRSKGRKNMSGDVLARDQMLLQQNKAITQSPLAQKLAWEAFSSQEADRIDRGRDALMCSGLWDDDLEKEAQGLANNLPEWRKARTGQFASREEELPKLY